MSALVKQLEDALHDQPSNPLRPAQRQDYEEERTRLHGIVNAPAWVQADRGAATARLQQVTKTLNEQAAKPISGDRQNVVKDLAGKVIDTIIKPTMLPQSVMRRNPPGAVDRTLKGEFSSAYKRAAYAVKRALFALDPETTDPNHANLERFRAEGLMPNGLTADAQFPGYISYSHIPDEKWPFAPPTNTAVAQVARVEKTKPELSAEARKAIGVRLKAARAAKKAAQGVSA